MDVGEWSASLDWLLSPEGWVGPERGPEEARAARQTLDDLAHDRAWIGHGLSGIPGGKRSTEMAGPDVRKAELQRSVMLALALAQQLRSYETRAEGPPCGSPSFVRSVAAALLQADTGVRPRSVVKANKSGSSFDQVDFAHEPYAKVFFENYLSAVLARFDAEYGTSLAAHAGSIYDPDDDASIERWGQAWSASVSMVLLHWFSKKMVRGPGALVRALWWGVGDDGVALPGLNLSGGPLPSCEKRVHVELRTNRRLAQVLKGTTGFWSPPPDESATVRWTLGSTTYRMVAGKPLYEACTNIHLHAAVLVVGLAALNGLGDAAATPPSRSTP